MSAATAYFFRPVAAQYSATSRNRLSLITNTNIRSLLAPCNNIFASVFDRANTAMERLEEECRRLMTARGIDDVATLAERAGVNRSHVYQVWKPGGDRRASVDTIARLAHALGVSIGTLLGERAPAAAHQRLIAMLETLSARERARFLELLGAVADSVAENPAN
ncbi:MAG: helix-turn-helix transcriptional regulator, partial [Thermoanaerobaculia bacterium]